MRPLAWAAGRARRIRPGPALVPATLLFGNLAVFLPAALYRDNAPFFFFSLAQYLLVLVPLAAALIGAACLVAGQACRRWQQGVVAGLYAAGLAAWAGSAFLYTGQGSLDGTPLRLESAGSSAWLNAVACCLLAAAAGWLSLRAAHVARWFATALSALLLSLTVHALAVDPNPWREVADEQRFLRFSRERNVLVVLMDTFQADFMTSILQADPTLADRLDGFTFLPDTVGAAPSTLLSMPAIHAGLVYRPGGSISGLYDQAVSTGSFGQALAQAGVEGTLLNPILGRCPAGLRCTDQDTLLLGRLGSVSIGAASLLDMALLRAAPSLVQPHVYRDGRWLLGSTLRTSDAGAAASNRVLEQLAARLRTDAPTPSFKFLHLVNTHPPADLDADCRRVHGQPWTRPAAIAQATCGVGVVTGLLDRLKAEGLYDRTLIVLMADHGAGLSVLPGAELRASASPVLLVKPIGQRGTLRVSHAAGSLTDLPATVCALSQYCRWPRGRNLFDPDPQVPRAHTFVAYKWRHEYWRADVIPSVDLWSVRGSPMDAAAWTRQTTSSGEPRATLQFSSDDTERPYGQGWSHFEADEAHVSWRWAMGDAAGLVLSPPQGWTGRIRIGLSTHAANPRQAIEVIVDGQRLFDGWPQQSVLELTVPEQMRDRKTLQVAFRFAQFNPPGNGDPRPLAVSFDYLHMQ